MPSVRGIFNLGFGFVTSETERGPSEAPGDRRVIHYFNSALITITLHDNSLLTYCSCKINFSTFLPFHSLSFSLALSILFLTKSIVIYAFHFPHNKTMETTIVLALYDNKNKSRIFSISYFFRLRRKHTSTLFSVLRSTE